MSRLGLRARFALLAAALVALIASLVGAGAYLMLRGSLHARAQRQAADEARKLAALVDVGGTGQSQQSNRVDLTDPSLTRSFTGGELRVAIVRPGGRLVQAQRGAPRLPAPLRARCLRDGAATARLDRPPAALACVRVARAGRPVAAVAVAAPLADAERALARLAEALAIGVAAGTLLAAALARAVAQRALRPARQIATAAESIRAGDRSRRIAYRGPRDELGKLADVLDASFDELEQALQRQRRFVADASHELRTPIAAIRAHVELLGGWAGQRPQARAAALASLAQASRTASRLVADLLYLAQLDRLPPPANGPTSLDEVLLDAVRETQALRPAIPVRVARLDEVQLRGDGVRLRQLLVNLLDNALRVSPQGGEVTVELAHRDRLAEIVVADRGPGIAEDELERIFDRFHSGDPGRAGSAGLGLAIARDIARGHGGDVSAGNRPDGGALLRVTLPVEADGAQARA